MPAPRKSGGRGERMDSIGIGIVGAGAIARRVLEHLVQPDVRGRVRLAAVCDPAPVRAEAAAAQYGIASWYTDYEALLRDPDVDMVTLCTPIGLHFSQGMLAIEAGKHVHYNKTMAVTSAEAGELIAAAARRGIKQAASPGNMLWPFNQRKRKYLLEGRLGRLVWAAGSSGDAAGYHLNETERHALPDAMHNVSPAWYFSQNGGGPLYDSTVYALHSLTGVIGPARTVTAVTSRMREEFLFGGKPIPNEMDDFVMMLLGFDNGAYGLVASLPTEEPVSLGGQFGVFYGLDGFINENGLNGQGRLKYEGDRMPHHFGGHGRMWECHVYEDVMQLADWVAGEGAEPICSTAHARHVIEIIEGCYASAASGRTVPLETVFSPLDLDEIDEYLDRWGGNGPSVPVPRFGGDYTV